MRFSESERQLLLATPFVGATVIERLETIGIDSLEALAASSTDRITQAVAELLGSTCWKNSPQARKAIDNAIEAAQRHIGEP